MLSHPARDHWEARSAGVFSFASYSNFLLPPKLWGVVWVFKGDLSIIGHNIPALSPCLWPQHIHSDLVFLSKKISSEPLSQTWTNHMFLCCGQPNKTFRAYFMSSTVLLGTHLMLTPVAWQISRCKANLSHCQRSKTAWTSCTCTLGRPTEGTEAFCVQLLCWWLAKQRAIGHLALFWLSLVDIFVCAVTAFSSSSYICFK